MRTLLAISAMFLLLGCVSSPTPAKQGQPSFSAAQLCVQTCETVYRNEANLSVGPCLGLITEDYVCDVAHSPRAAVDNLAENQCPQYASGQAHHFVEVTPECKLIQVS